MGFGDLDWGNFSHGDPIVVELDKTIIGKRADLTLDTGVPSQPAGWTPDGWIGYNKRAAANNDTRETFVEFDVRGSIPIGSNIVSAQVEFDVDGTGTAPSTWTTSQLIQQDKTAYTVWDGAGRQPWFDDFAQTVWATIIDNTLIKTLSSTYAFTPNVAIKDLVQDWLDDVIDYRNGVVIDADPGSKTYWWHVSAVRLVVVYNPPVTAWLSWYVNKKKQNV